MSSTWRGIILLQLTILVYALTKKFGWSYPELEELYMGSYNTFLSGMPASFGNLTKLVSQIWVNVDSMGHSNQAWEFGEPCHALSTAQQLHGCNPVRVWQPGELDVT